MISNYSNRNILLSTLVAILVVCGCLELSGQVVISAEIRPRLEMRNGFKTPIQEGVDPAFFIEQRSRFSANYTAPKFSLVFTFQDVRTWGSVDQIYKTDPSLFNIYEAYGTYNISDKHKVGAGRMALNYDNARFLGNLDWAQQGRSHDLIKYSYASSDFKLDVGLAFNQDASTPEYQKLNGTNYSGVNNYKTMQYAWANKAFESGSISFLVLNSGAQFAPDTVNFSQTLGTYLKTNLGKTLLEFEFYYQGGKTPVGKDLSAYLVSANWGFLNKPKFGLSVGVDYLSGDNPDSDKNESFTPLYGTNHKFYGYMDYFYVGNGHKEKGLVDLMLKSKIKLGSKTDFTIHLHQFLAQSKIPDPSGSGDLSSNLGTEIDFAVISKLTEGVTLMGGYSHMFNTESLNSIKGSTNAKGVQNWVWVMIQFKPVLYDSSKKKKDN